MGEAQKHKEAIIVAVARQPGYHSNQVATMATNIEVPCGTNINVIYELFMKQLGFLYFLLYYYRNQVLLQLRSETCNDVYIH